jgi:probable F420-dependent oxidoreductase
MKFGITMFPTDESIPVVELARAVEAAGFESLFVPEHTHIPVASVPPTFPREYSHLLDPFVALAAAAAATTRLLLGTGVCLVMERDPITLAKEVASLDYVSGGRFLFGIGGGWNQAEMQHHGTRPSLRWRILRERVLAMKQIWTQDVAEFHGRFVDFAPLWSWPKPVQRPHPPILVGGNGARTLERVVEYGDGWIPIGGQIGPDGAWRPVGTRGPSVIERIPTLQQMAAAAGRGSLPVTIFGAPPTREGVEPFEQAGVARCLFWLPPLPTAGFLPLLERCAAVAAGFR